MGLAASQARLLSITSRISDNELRAQLINNQKMRLSADSSKVSEYYINALNKTNLVFANYDKDDKAQNVPLTFNNLTSFNQYNNQYGLTNTAGNILISESDAEKYKNSGGDSEEFLKQYGIEYTTSYWDTLDEQLRTNESFYSNPDGDGVAEPDGEGFAKFDSAGKTISNKTTDGKYNFFTADQLKEMYEGNETSNPKIPSYNDTIKTSKYNDFAGYVDSFSKMAASITQSAAQRNQLMNSYALAVLNAGETLKAINNLNNIPSDFSAINNALSNDIKKYFTFDANVTIPTIDDDILKTISSNGSYGYMSGSLNDYLDNNVTSLYSSGYNANALYLKIPNPMGGYDYYAKVNNPSGEATPCYAKIPTSGTASSAFYTWNGSTMTAITIDDQTPGLSVQYNGNSLKCSFEDGEGGNFTYKYPDFNPALFPATGTSGDASTTTISREVPLNELLNELKRSLKEAATKCILAIVQNGAQVNASNFVSKYPLADGTMKEFTTDEKNILSNTSANDLQLGEVIKNISKIVFGEDQNGNPLKEFKNDKEVSAFLDYIMDGKWDKKKDIELTLADSVGTKITIPANTIQKDFMPLVNAYVIDTMMDLFGEPIYGYMKKDSTGNWVTAKEEATWYLNIFNKIKECGYQMIPKGLANSTEWIQFALENGIVTLEQINSEANWQPITYTSCSDIIEQNDKTAATVAEAEYNKAMRQIEAKDEMFDLELKNIDTEHSALESEYESVKKAMSGNIERTFQMYS